MAAVDHAAPRIYVPAFVRGPERSSGAIVVGIDAARELAAIDLAAMVPSGAVPIDREFALVGSELAAALGVTVGAELAMVLEPVDGATVQQAAGQADAAELSRTGPAARGHRRPMNGLMTA